MDDHPTTRAESDPTPQPWHFVHTAVSGVRMARECQATDPERAFKNRAYAVELRGEPTVAALEALNAEQFAALARHVGRQANRETQAAYAPQIAASKAAWAAKVAAERRRAEARIARWRAKQVRRAAVAAARERVLTAIRAIRDIVTQPSTTRSYRSNVGRPAMASAGGGDDSSGSAADPSGPAARLGVLHLDNLKLLALAVLVCAAGAFATGYVLAAALVVLLPELVSK